MRSRALLAVPVIAAFALDAHAADPPPPVAMPLRASDLAWARPSPDDSGAPLDPKLRQGRIADLGGTDFVPAHEVVTRVQGGHGPGPPPPPRPMKSPPPRIIVPADAIDYGVGRVPAVAIQRVVRLHAGEFRACASPRSLAHPQDSGRIKVAFTISTTGAVSDAQVLEAPLYAVPGVRSCVVDVFKRLVFPTNGSGVIRVTYPVVFESN